MRQDKTFVRILLIFSIFDVALAAPAVLRQRHPDVVKAASEKRGPGSDDGETSNLPPEPASPMPPHDPPPDKTWWDWLGPDSPKSSSAAEDRITTQASGASGSGNGATGDSSPESSSGIPPHGNPKDKWAWLYRGSLPGSSSAEDSPITTQTPGTGSGATDDLPPESSSAAANRITTHASGAAGLGSGATSDSLPVSSVRVPPHDSRPPNVGLDLPSSPESSSGAAGRITTQASGSSTSESTSDSRISGLYSGDLPPLGLHPNIASSFESLATPEDNGILSDLLKHKLLVSSGAIGLIGGTAAVAYSIHQLTKNPYVSPLSLFPFSPVDI